ncbi:MAG TPA: hypothetical protein VGN48_01235 [Pedococcus sp.]|nr:hypothetical protein [Pedococcus sp.]
MNRGVYDCGSSADYGVACWRASARATMYCLQNPFGKNLAQLALTDTALPGAPAPVVATPLGLVLDDGAHCLIRDGGSWSSLPGYPEWYGTYFCNSANDQIVWAPGVSDGVDRTTATWTVVTTGRSSTPVTHAVTMAYFAGY